MARLKLIKKDEEKAGREEELGGQMSFLEHLDELRTRLIRSMAFVLSVAYVFLVVSGYIYSLLARSINYALAKSQQQKKATIAGLNGQHCTVPHNSVH